jgi:hypothetical protein
MITGSLKSVTNWRETACGSTVDSSSAASSTPNRLAASAPRAAAMAVRDDQMSLRALRRATRLGARAPVAIRERALAHLSFRQLRKEAMLPYHSIEWNISRRVQFGSPDRPTQSPPSPWVLSQKQVEGSPGPSNRGFRPIGISNLSCRTAELCRRLRSAFIPRLVAVAYAAGLLL